MLARARAPLGRGTLAITAAEEAHHASGRRMGHGGGSGRHPQHEPELEDDRDLRAEPGRVEPGQAGPRREVEQARQQAVPLHLRPHRPGGDGRMIGGGDPLQLARGEGVAAGALLEVAHRVLPRAEARPFADRRGIRPGPHLQPPLALGAPPPGTAAVARGVREAEPGPRRRLVGDQPHPGGHPAGHQHAAEQGGGDPLVVQHVEADVELGIAEFERRQGREVEGVLMEQQRRGEDVVPPLPHMALIAQRRRRRRQGRGRKGPVQIKAVSYRRAQHPLTTQATIAWAGGGGQDGALTSPALLSRPSSHLPGRGGRRQRISVCSWSPLSPRKGGRRAGREGVGGVRGGQCYSPPPSVFDLMEVSSLMESTQKQAWMGTLEIVLAAAAALALPTVLTGAPKAPAAAAAIQLPPGAEKAAQAMDRASLEAPLRFLSGDLMEGRGPASRGDETAQLYLASMLESLGYQPALSKGEWQQRFDLVGVKAEPPKTWSFKAGGQTVDLKWWDDFIAFSGVQAPASSFKDAELVFVGYGIQAPEYQWDDFKGMNLRGKVLVMLNNDPDWDPKLFAGERRLYYGRWTYKYESAARQGAAGVIILHTTPSAGYPWQVVQTSWSGEQFALPVGPKEPQIQVKGWATEEATRRLLKAAGKDLDELVKE